MVTAVHTDKLTFGVMVLAQLAALATPACQSSDRASDVGAAISAETSQVKPATGRATSAAEPEPLAAPEPEAAELPRGVSAPQPDEREPEVAVAPKPSSPSAKPTAPSPAAAPKPSAPPSAAEVSSKPKPAPAAFVKKPAAPFGATPAHAQSKPAAPKPPPAPPALVPPEPIAAPVAPAPPPKKVSVNVPQTDHVRVEVPTGLQHWLDEDDRMRPWLGKAVDVADSCYSKVRADNPGASGEIAFVVTMHENARPSGKVSSVSSPISGIVMCATTRLLGVKMPLFTGREGESHTVRVRFEP
jgi:hypothetical protein